MLWFPSQEPFNLMPLGDGNTEPDWQIVDNTHVTHRAERSGRGNGRVYSINVQCMETHQNICNIFQLNDNY